MQVATSVDEKIHTQAKRLSWFWLTSLEYWFTYLMYDISYLQQWFCWVQHQIFFCNQNMWKVCFRNVVEPGVLLLSAMKMHIKTSCKMYINAIHEHLSTCWIVQLLDNHGKDPSRMCAYMSQRLDQKHKTGLVFSWSQKRDGMVWESEQKMWILNKLPLEGNKVHFLCVLRCAELPTMPLKLWKSWCQTQKLWLQKKAAGSNLQFFLHFYTLQADNGVFYFLCQQAKKEVDKTIYALVLIFYN